MTIIEISAWAVATPLSAVNLLAALEIWLGAMARPQHYARPDGDLDVVILVPAHDERQGLARTLERLEVARGPTMRVLVVADNCTDDTANIARSCGVEVIERQDPAHRGKGFALAFGRAHLAQCPPAVVVVLDADCTMDDQSLRRLARTTFQEQVPVQAINLLSPDRGAPAPVQVGAFAFAVKNEIRQLGLRRLGGPALLNGTGMAFPWATFADAPLASGHLAEDLELGIALAARGCFARLEPAARVFSPVSSLAGTMSQRTRWERGFLANALRNALPTIARGVVQRSWRQLALGADLLIPPLALLILLSLAGLAAALLFYALGATAKPALALGASIALLGMGLVAAWLRCGRPYLSGAALLRLPLYVLWKIPLYAGVLLKKPAQWTRTDRS